MIIPRDILSAITDKEAEVLHSLPQGRRVLELGAQYGFSTVVLAQSASIVHSVDWHKGDGDLDSLPAMIANLVRYNVRDKVIVHVGTFESIYPILASDVFDGVFVDGMHDETSVRRDLFEAHRLVRSGGWIALHDVGRDHLAGFGVDKALASFMGAHWNEYKASVTDHLAVLRPV